MILPAVLQRVNAGPPRLLVWYAPQVLVVMRRTLCPGTGKGWGGELKHGGACFCHGTKSRFVTVGVPCLLTPVEQSWVLSRSFIPRREDVAV